MTRDQVISKLRELAPALRDRFDVAAISIFGSVARGDAVPGSDVDVLIRFQPDATITLLDLAAIRCELIDALGCNVDLIEDHPRLRPSFRLAVEQDLVHVA